MARPDRTSGRPRRSILAAPLALGMASHAPETSAQDASASLDMARKKAAMLESFLEADRLRTALDARPEAAGALVEAARIHLESGSAALSANRPLAATASLDKGIATVSRAIALAGTEPQNTGEGLPERYTNRLGEAESYLAVLWRDDTLSEADAKRTAALQAQLKEAQRLVDFGAGERARALIDTTYAKAIALVSALQRGQTAFVSKTFDTAEEAYAHERARHDNYRRLVQLALIERGGFQPGLATLAANLGTLSDRLRTEAERQVAAGETAKGVESMRRATDRLLAILRAAGLVLTDERRPLR